MDKAVEAQKALWEYIKANGCQMFDDEHFIVVPKACAFIEQKLGENKLVENELVRVG